MSKIRLYQLSDQFADKLITLNAGYFSPAVMDEFFQKIDVEIKAQCFTSESEANLIRIFSAQLDKKAFLKELIKYPHRIKIITAIAANSNYLTDIAVINPGYLYQIFNHHYLEKVLTQNELEKELQSGLDKFDSFTAQLKFLHRFKRRTILKIGVRDILGMDDIKSTTEYLSILANAICASLFDLCYKKTKVKYDIKRDTGKYVLASLGKLGGNELNYSSDVDLLLFYDKDKNIGTPKRTDYHEVLSEAAQLFIQTCTDNSNGSLYRIDFRLRPEGQFSSLCSSMSGYLRYYEVRGANWERQMLIKMGFVAGSRTLYDSFKKLVTPFIYPASFLVPPLEQIRKMKKNIEASIGSAENVKLFHGGIRDIEFSVQALQLLNGGKNGELQTGNTLEAIDKLQTIGLLKSNEAQKLTEAYCFYRRIEHYLQLMNDIQTHTIPAKGELPAKLAVYSGLDTIKNFNAKMDKHRIFVRKIYNSITKSKQGTDKSARINLNEIKFVNSERALKNYRYLKTGTGLFDEGETDKITNKSFEKIEPTLLAYLDNARYPDRILENLVRIISGISLISVWYSEFTNKNLFNDFLRVCEYSQQAAENIVFNKFDGEMFLTRKVFAKDIDAMKDATPLKQLIFILTIQFTLGLISREKFSKLLSGCVSYKIAKAADKKGLPYNYFMGGLGSFAIDEINLGSDIDIIIITDKIDVESTIQDDFQELLNDLQKEVQPFQLDARLRPEGKNSPLVWDLESYDHYLTSRAGIWEFQSFLKLKYISGSTSIFNKFEKLVVKGVSSLEENKVTSEIKEMFIKIQRQNISSYSSKINIKKAWGGLQHVIFLLDSIILKEKDYYKDNTGKSIKKRIDYLLKKEIVGKDFETLRDNYAFLKLVQLSIQNITNNKKTLLPNSGKELELISEFVYGSYKKDINTRIDKALKSNAKIIEKYWR